MCFRVLAAKPQQLSFRAVAVNSHVDGFEEWISDAAKPANSGRGKSDKILARIRFNNDWFRRFRETVHPKKFYSLQFDFAHIQVLLFLQHSEAITENLSNFIRFNKHIHLSSKGNLKINKNPISVIWCLFPRHGGYYYCQTPNTNFFDPHRMSQLLKAIFRVVWFGAQSQRTDA